MTDTYPADSPADSRTARSRSPRRRSDTGDETDTARPREPASAPCSMHEVDPGYMGLAAADTGRKARDETPGDTGDN